MKKKLITFNKFEHIKNKNNLKKIVLCHGVFDVLHFGHIRHLEAAKNYGDTLIVSLTSDKFVNKGPGRPYFKLQNRLETISALECVDYIIVSDFPDALNVIKLVKPNYYCKGIEYKSSKKDITKKILKEKKAVESFKGKIIYTNEETYSSSKLIKNNLNFNTPQNKFLRTKLKNIDFKHIETAINKFKDLNILLIGEAIIDEYVFCDPVGKSGKESLLVFKELKTEKYIGGSLAIANTLSNFCNSVTVICSIGEKKEHISFIKDNINKNINLKFVYKKNSPTIVKKRFIDQIDNRKILGVYSLIGDNLNKKDQSLLNQSILKYSKKNDLVITVDYGHGLISNSTSKIISKLNKFKTINAQLNSFNIGDHSLRKYQTINCIVINESELRHELRNQSDSVKDLMKDLFKIIKFKFLIVTQGRNGATLYDSEAKKYFDIPAFGTLIKDKIGAGDSMLSLLSMSLFQKNDIYLSLLLGSIASAFSISTLANKDIISQQNILKTLKHLL